MATRLYWLPVRREAWEGIGESGRAWLWRRARAGAVRDAARSFGVPECAVRDRATRWDERVVPAREPWPEAVEMDDPRWPWRLLMIVYRISEEEDRP